MANKILKKGLKAAGKYAGKAKKGVQAAGSYAGKASVPGTKERRQVAKVAGKVGKAVGKAVDVMNPGSALGRKAAGAGRKEILLRKAGGKAATTAAKSNLKLQPLRRKRKQTKV